MFVPQLSNIKKLCFLPIGVFLFMTDLFYAIVSDNFFHSIKYQQSLVGMRRMFMRLTGAAAQSVESPLKGPRSVQLYRRRFESQPRHKMIGKINPSRAIWN